MKGISPFISTAFIVLFGVVLISAVVFTLGSVQEQGIERSVSDQLTVTSREMATEILDIYNGVKGQSGSSENNSVFLVRETEVRLPQTIGSRNYQMSVEEPQDVLLAVVQFIIDGIVVNTTSTRPTARIVAESENVLIENKLYNIDMGLQGYTKGGPTKIRGFKYNYNGGSKEKIVVGDDTIIVGIQNFSTTTGNCPSNKMLTLSGHNIYTSGTLPSTLNFRATILETSEFNVTTSENPFTILICTSIGDQTEGTVLLEVWDANNNRGSIRKKFLG